MNRLLLPVLVVLLIAAMAVLRPAADPAATAASQAIPQLADNVLLSKAASASAAAPGTPITYTITVTNDVALDDTFALTDTLPAGLVVDSASITGGATYDPDTHMITWAGTLGPGGSYQISDSRSGGQSFTYKDLSATPGNQLACSQDCDNTVYDDSTLGLNNRSVDFYGIPYGRWNLHTNGFIQPYGTSSLGNTRAVTIPTNLPPNEFFAGLWNDLDLDGTSASDAGGGTWYATIVNGVDPLRPNDVFYVVQWKNVQQLNAPSSSLNFEIVARTGQRGDICVIYGAPFTGDLVRGAPNNLPYSGVAVGIEDASGQNGAQAYYSDNTTTVGTAPAPGVTICAVPTPKTKHTITYRATANVSGTFVNTVTASSRNRGSIGSASASVTFSGATATPSNTPTSSATQTPSQTPSNTVTGTPPTATNTATPTGTATNTVTGTPPTATSTATPTGTGTACCVPTATAPNTATPTGTGTACCVPTATAPNGRVVLLPFVAR